MEQSEKVVNYVDKHLFMCILIYMMVFCQVQRKIFWLSTDDLMVTYYDPLSVIVDCINVWFSTGSVYRNRQYLWVAFL